MNIIYVFLIILNLLFYQSFVKSSFLLGIDLGSEFIKVSILSPGKGFNILLNNQSKRKITNSISFANNFRVFEDEANAYSTKKPELTILNSNSFLGFNIYDKLKNKADFSNENIDYNDEFYKDTNNYDFSDDIVAKYYVYDYVVNTERGTINVKLKNDLILSSEEITANILNYVKKLALNHLHIDYKVKKNLNTIIGCVLSVPCNYSHRKRQDLVNATKIAGLELLGIINGITAAAIHNVYDLAINTSKLTMYLDIGSHYVNVGVSTISYTEKNKERSRNVNVYACESIENNSGNKIDILLAEHLRKKFEKKHKVSIGNDRKALRKLLNAAKKTKILLSARKSTDVFVESLFDYKTLSETITRQELEELLPELINNIKIVIKNALKKTSFELKDIESIELIGSAWRVPKILDELIDFFKPLKIGMHLNSDESVAMGSIHSAAYHSTSFQLKNLYYSDIISSDYSISFSYDNSSNSDNMVPKELISYSSKFPVKKSVILKYKDNLKFDIFENGKLIIKYSLENLDEKTKKKYEHLGVPNINLKFKLDSFGLLNLEKTVVVYEEEKEVSKDKGKAKGEEEEKEEKKKEKKKRKRKRERKRKRKK